MYSLSSDTFFNVKVKLYALLFHLLFKSTPPPSPSPAESAFFFYKEIFFCRHDRVSLLRRFYPTKFTPLPPLTFKWLASKRQHFINQEITL